jgi:hypothetical protein
MAARAVSASATASAAGLRPSSASASSDSIVASIAGHSRCDGTKRAVASCRSRTGRPGTSFHAAVVSAPRRGVSAPGTAAASAFTLSSRTRNRARRSASSLRRDVVKLASNSARASVAEWPVCAFGRGMGATSTRAAPSPARKCASRRASATRMPSVPAAKASAIRSGSATSAERRRRCSSSSAATLPGPPKRDESPSAESSAAESPQANGMNVAKRPSPAPVGRPKPCTPPPSFCTRAAAASSSPQVWGTRGTLARRSSARFT